MEEIEQELESAEIKGETLTEIYNSHPDSWATRRFTTNPDLRGTIILDFIRRQFNAQQPYFNPEAKLREYCRLMQECYGCGYPLSEADDRRAENERLGVPVEPSEQNMKDELGVLEKDESVKFYLSRIKSYAARVDLFAEHGNEFPHLQQFLERIDSLREKLGKPALEKEKIGRIVPETLEK